MIEDRELDAAIAAGIIDAATRDRLVAFVRDHRRGASGPDEEQFRLLTGFNDIFVTIAIALLLFAVGSIGGSLAPWLSAVAVAATAWMLAEYFTRRRRMALPSIVLLLVFVAAAYLGAGNPFFVSADVVVVPGTDGSQPSVHREISYGNMAFQWAALLAGALAAFVHWRRFKVPITVAAAATVVSLSLIAYAAMTGLAFAAPVTSIACGIAVFALAMWYDGRDPQRVTRRADIAFWLHLLAAPLIVHPVFTALAGASGAGAELPAAAAAIAVYLTLALVALAVDRRALLVSGLVYVLTAVSTLVTSAAGLGAGVAVTALVVGIALVLLAAGWRQARSAVLRLVPAGLRMRLPAAA